MISEKVSRYTIGLYSPLERRARPEGPPSPANWPLSDSNSCPLRLQVTNLAHRLREQAV